MVHLEPAIFTAKCLAAFPGKIPQRREILRPGACINQIRQTVSHMGKKVPAAPLQPQKPVSAKGLHESLRRGLPKPFLILRPVQSRPMPLIMIPQQRQALTLREGDIGVVEERPQVVEKAAEPHPLKVDQDRLAAPDHDVLRLEIAMDQHRAGLFEPLCEAGKLGFELGRSLTANVQTAEGPHEMILEIIPFPPVQVRPERFHQGNGLRREIRRRKAVQFVNENERFPVADPADSPGLIPQRPEIPVSQVFHDDEPADRIMLNDAGDRNSDALQERGDCRVQAVLRGFALIPHEHGAAVAAVADAPVGAIRPAPGKRIQPDGIAFGQFQRMPDKGADFA